MWQTEMEKNKIKDFVHKFCSHSNISQFYMTSRKCLVSLSCRNYVNEKLLMCEAVVRPIAVRLEIPSVLWNLKVHYCVHKNLPVFHILSQMIPIHTLPTYFPKIRFSIIVPSVARSSGHFVPFSLPSPNILCICHLPCMLHAVPTSSS